MSLCVLAQWMLLVYVVHLLCYLYSLRVFSQSGLMQLEIGHILGDFNFLNNIEKDYAEMSKINVSRWEHDANSNTY